MSEQLKPCPCGDVPKKLEIYHAGHTTLDKWAWVSESCCGQWNIEFRTNYHSLDSSECMTCAISVWNGTKRK